MNIIEYIIQEGVHDDEDTEKQSKILNDLYDDGTPEQKKVIDETLTCVCGWTMKSIRKQTA